MKRRIIIAAIIIAAIAALVLVQVPTKQGINYVVRTYKVPLYIKIIEYIDRNYHYNRIVREITYGLVADDDKVLAIFSWCVQHVKPQPAELPIVDDHQHNIIIRGYGVNDQCEDIFTLLCNYAGFESFYKGFASVDGKNFYVSLVKMHGAWRPFSAYYAACIHKDGKLLSVDDLKSDSILMEQFVRQIPGLDAKSLAEQLKRTEFKASSIRVRGQNPFGRLKFHIEKLPIVVKHEK